MKRFVSLYLLVILLILLLCSCTQGDGNAPASGAESSKPVETSEPEESSEQEKIVMITDYEYRISYTDILDPGGLFPNGQVCFDRSTIDSVLEEIEKHNLFNIDREEYGYPSLRQRYAEYDDAFFETKALLIIVVDGDDDEPPEIRCIYKQFLENINTYETWVRFKRYYKKNNQGYTVLVELDADLVRDTTRGIAFQERVNMAPEYEYSFPGEG